MINKENIEIIYPGIMVFRNGIPNPEEIVKELSAYSNWENWYDIGEQIVTNPNYFLKFDNFPSTEEWLKSQDFQKERIAPTEIKDLVELFETCFFESTQHYVEFYNKKLSNWVHAASNVLRYKGREAKPKEVKGGIDVKNPHDTTKGEAGSTKEMTLPFHTDFYQREEFEPGLKAEYTVTMYLNENYNGGEIDFRIFNDNENQMRVVGGDLQPIDPDYGDIPSIIYKPRSGDIIIFPSRVPYYHGVRRVLQGKKYFVRMFWMSNLEKEVI